MDLTTLFCEIDDFTTNYFKTNTLALPNKEPNGKKTRNRKHLMSPSEIMTIVVAFQDSGYRNFKTFYLQKVLGDWTTMFPCSLSYNRFVAIMPKISVCLAAFLQLKMDDVTGISYI